MSTIINRPRAAAGLFLASVALALGLAQPHAAQAATCANADTPFSEPVRFAGEPIDSYSQRYFRLQNDVRNAIVCLTNNERTARGLQSLVLSTPLHKAAQSHAVDMVSKRYFSHTSPTGTTPLSRSRAAGYCSTGRLFAVAENIFWASGSPTARQVVQGWMNSSAHRTNILRSDRKDIGVGAQYGTPTGVKGGTFVQLIGVCA